MYVQSYRTYSRYAKTPQLKYQLNPVFYINDNDNFPGRGTRSKRAK